MEDSSCSRTCDKSRPVSGCVAHELFRHLVGPLIIGNVAEDEPAKRDQVGGTWPGNPDATTALPQQMLVDYVRVYQHRRRVQMK